MKQYILKDKSNKNWTGCVVINSDGSIIIKEINKKRKLKKWVNNLILYIIWLLVFIIILIIEYNLFNI